MPVLVAAKVVWRKWKSNPASGKVFAGRLDTCLVNWTEALTPSALPSFFVEGVSRGRQWLAQLIKRTINMN